MNAYDPGDFDRDGTPAATDCDDADPFAAPPPAVDGVTVESIGSTARVAWTAQGAGVVYDVATGSLLDLATAGGFTGASCLADDETGSSVDDVRADPPPGDGYHYVARAAKAACIGSYGAPGTPRTDLDTGSPCP